MSRDSQPCESLRTLYSGPFRHLSVAHAKQSPAKTGQAHSTETGLDHTADQVGLVEIGLDSAGLLQTEPVSAWKGSQSQSQMMVTS